MGASSSTLKRLTEEEFNRLSQGRPHIVLDDILEFRLSSGGWVVRTDCIGLLYSVDKCGLLTVPARMPSQPPSGLIMRCLTEVNVFAAGTGTVDFSSPS
jgi:hypothetical protein